MEPVSGTQAHFDIVQPDRNGEYGGLHIVRMGQQTSD